MALTQLADAVIPEVFAPYMFKDTMTKTSIFTSGIMRQDAQIADFLRGGGYTVNIPFWKDLGDTEASIGSDSTSDVLTPAKLTSGKQIAVRNVRAYAWSAAKLTAELAGSDPMMRIRERVSAYWDRQFQTSLVQILKGVFADNTANDSADMQNVIGNDSASAVTSAELISAEAILDTKQTMGDAGDELSVIIMHSICYTRLQKQNLIDFIPDSEGVVRFPTYLGYRVIVNDNVLTAAGSNRTKYSTYLLGAGSIAWAETPVATPVEVDREPLQGNGQGVDTLVTRRQFVMHPYGFQFKSASVSGEFPTNAEHATAANWDRVVAERKQAPIAQLVTNG